MLDIHKKFPVSIFQIIEDSPPMSTFGQLLWLEFFYTAATKNPNFDKMIGNPICVQIPWDDNPPALAKWASGKTGNFFRQGFSLKFIEQV